ncbi:beta strand repeat-containing protein [Spirosoma endbachense]|uniref:Tandem-95 repeat protein n=1 Tax=Spirosoma endbachense TaxID=2666025 RepID=A0A6P1VU37_9BACT|nr:Ig-like domain-containing protein [Spirosoma endbachense]QHV94876.1 tandem-95 repeat protein [Spirosoma endbachense]
MKKLSTYMCRRSNLNLFTWVFLCLSLLVSTNILAQLSTAPCNTVASLTNPTFANLTVTSSQFIGDEFTNKANLIDNDPTFSTDAFYLAALGSSAWLEVRDHNATGANVYPAGTFAGFIVSSDVKIGGTTTISTYLSTSPTPNTPVTTKVFTNLAEVGLLNGKARVGLVSTGSFDIIRINFGGLAATIHVYAPVIEKFCNTSPALVCNTPTSLTAPGHSVFFNPDHTGITTDVACLACNITDPDNIIDGDPANSSSIILTAGVATTASIGVKNAFVTYPASTSSTFVGFDISSTALVDLGVLDRLTVSTYKTGTTAAIQSFTGANLVSTNSSILSGTGRRTIGFLATLDFDEVRLTVTKAAGVSLATLNIFGVVVQKFCDGPSFLCIDNALPKNTLTPLINPTHPVYVDGANTGVDALVCVGCNINNSQNVVDSDPSNSATIVLTAGVATNASFAVANAVDTYPAGTFAGFNIETATLLSANAISKATITLYNNGTLVQPASATENVLIVGATTGLLTSGPNSQTLGIVAKVPFDEVKITFNQVVGVDLGTIKIFNAIIQKSCADPIACNNTYYLNRPGTPAVIDAANTGVTGIANPDLGIGAGTNGTINEPWNVVSASTTDFARITNTVSAARASIAVVDPVSTFPIGTFAGFTIQKRSGLVAATLFPALTVSTYLDGQLQETNITAGGLLDLTVILQIFGTTPGDFINAGFITTKPFDEIKLSVGSLANINALTGFIDVYGAFIDTRTSTGGGLVCALNTNPDFAVTNKNVPATGSVKTNDVVPAGTTYGPAPAPTSQPGGSSPSLTVNSDGTYTFTSSTPGVYVYSVPVCGTGLSGTACATQTLTVTVLDPTVNTNKPVANPDIASLTGAPTNPTSTTINVKANDGPGNPGGTLGTPTIATGPANGTATVDGNGNVVYTPNAGFYGTDVLTYTVCETPGVSLCASTTVTVTVKAPGSANTTTAADDYISTYQGTPITGNVKTNDSDPEGNTQTVTAQNTTIPGKGTLVLATDGSYTFTPVAGATGPVDFSYTTTDNGSPSASASGTLHILINPFNPNPDFAVTNKSVPVTGSVKTNDTVPVGSTYGPAPAPASQPGGSSPSLTVNPDGTFSFSATTPGVYVYNVPVCAVGTPPVCTTQTLTISVLDPTVTTNPPVANPDFVTTTGAPGSPTAVTVNIKANDGPGNPGGTLNTPTIATNSTNGSASIDGSGNLVYTPNAGFYGTDRVTYQVCETPGTCATAVVTITVKAPGAPANVSINDDYVSTPSGTTATGNVLTNDLGNNLTVSSPTTTVTSSGTLVLTATGSYTFTPAPGVTGPVDFTYTACDNSTPSVCGSATLHVLIGQGLPDLTPSQLFSSSQIAPGQTIDVLVAIRNVGATPTSAQVVFNVTNYIASTGLTMVVNTDPTVTIGGNVYTLNTNDFSVNSNQFAFTFTSVAGASGVIANAGNKIVAFKITRAMGSNSSSVTNTVTIPDGTGGGETPVNNNTIANTFFMP